MVGHSSAGTTSSWARSACAHSVGSAILELARLADVRTIGSTSTGKLELVRSLGAEPVDRLKDDVAARVRQLCPDGVDMPSTRSEARASPAHTVPAPGRALRGLRVHLEDGQLDGAN